MDEVERIRKYSIDFGEEAAEMNRVVDFDELLVAYDGRKFWIEHPPEDAGWDGVYSTLTTMYGQQLSGPKANWAYNEKTRGEYNRLYRAWAKPFRPMPEELAGNPWQKNGGQDEQV